MSEQSINATEAQPIPLDLQNQYNATKALVQIYQLLSQGMFSSGAFDAVNSSKAFITNLHQQSFDSVVNHSSSDLIEEIKKYKEDLNDSKEKSSNTDGHTVEDANYTSSTSL